MENVKELRNEIAWDKDLNPEQREAIRLKTIQSQLEEIASDMCENYCKYPEQWNEADGDMCDSDTCRNCPLTRI